MERNLALERFLGKVVEGKDGLRGKCIGYFPKSNDLAIIYNKGGWGYYIPADEAKIIR